MLALSLLLQLALSPVEGLEDAPRVPLRAEDPDGPALHLFLPPRGEKPTAAVIVCPGGGYGSLKTAHEGRDPAVRLKADGLAAFVLTYRLKPHPAPLDDAKRAVALIRSRAAEWNVDRVGAMGFSAGGHLAACLATMSDAPERPDFVALVYPVISFGRPHSHRGSERNLLGARSSDPVLLAELSPDRRVTSTSPRAFLVHSSEDTLGVENTLDYWRACRSAGVAAELHVYGHGRHGFGIGLRDAAGVGLPADDAVLSGWPALFRRWLGD